MDLLKSFTITRVSWLVIFVAVAALGGGNLWAQQASEPGQPSGDVSSSPTPANSQEHPNISLKHEDDEDLTTPSLKSSHLVAVDPFVVQTNRTPLYVREFLRVQWRPMDPMDLYVIRPTGVAKPPVVLYLYSYPSDTDRFHDNSFCEFLTKNGVAAVGFVSALTGHRYHARPFKQWFVSELKESLATSAHDVQMILNYLATRGDVDMDRVGMFGDGSGATIAILAAAVDPRIKALDLLDPWGDWPDWMAKSTRIPEKERPDLLKPDFLAGVAPLDPLKWLPELKTQKIRLQDVKSVTVTPEEARTKIEAAAPPNVQVIRYDDLEAFQQSMAGGTGFDWIKKQLGAASGQEYKAAGSSKMEASSE
jgi:hypothetical protein